MKHYRLLFAVIVLALCSCGKTPKQEEGTIPQPEKDTRTIICKFIAVNGFNPDMQAYDYRGNKSIILRFHGSSKFEQFFFDEVVVSQKECDLSDSLIDRFYSFDPVDPNLRLMYAGVSDRARVYSDKEVAGRAAGENLSDLFAVDSYGHIKYPEMEYVAVDSAMPIPGMGDSDYIRMTFEEYFSIGMVPSALEYGFIYLVIITDEIDETASLFFEIPVTGKLKNGEEKTIVFKAECPGKLPEPDSVAN